MLQGTIEHYRTNKCSNCIIAPLKTVLRKILKFILKLARIVNDKLADRSLKLLAEKLSAFPHFLNRFKTGNESEALTWKELLVTIRDMTSKL